MSTKHEVYAWDTCVFLAWMKQESDKNLGDIELLIRSIEDEKCTLVMSTIALTEMVDSEKSPSTYEAFRGFCKRDNVILYDVTPEVAELACKFRSSAISKSREKTRNSPKLSTPDAIHLATAKIFGADVFHSYDNAVLQFDKSDIVDELSIKKPCVLSGQMSLFQTVRLQCGTTMTAHMRSMVFASNPDHWTAFRQTPFDTRSWPNV